MKPKDQINIDGHTYRLVEEKKPERVKPKEWWLEFKYGSWPCVCSTKITAVEGSTVVHVREVLPNSVQVTKEDIANALASIGYVCREPQVFISLCKSLGLKEGQE